MRSLGGPQLSAISQYGWCVNVEGDLNTETDAHEGRSQTHGGKAVRS